MSWSGRRPARGSSAHLFGLLLVLVAADGSVAAQTTRVELDVTASRLRSDTLAGLDAPSVASLVEWQSSSLFARASGALTGLEGAGWSGQGRVDASGWFAPLPSARRLRLEVAGTGGASRHSSGFHASVARSDARLHLLGRSAGAFGGVGVAVAKSSFDSASVTGVVPMAGAWVQRGPVRATGTVQYTRLLGESYPEANVVLAFSRGRLDLTGYAGVRRPSLDASFDDEWLGGSAAVWLKEQVAVTVAGGRYASDVLQGLPGGSFFSVGVRLTPRRRRPIPQRVEAPIVYSAESIRAGGITLTVRGARTVEIAGDWNGWQLEPLERVGSDQWRVPASIGPGVHRFNLRVDGERWIVPDGVPEIEGGFGDRVGLLIITEG